MACIESEMNNKEGHTWRMCQRVSVQHLREIIVGCGIMKKVVNNLSRSLKVLTESP